MTKTVLVTGGAGYIGSHTVAELIQAGFSPIVLDNLSNSSPISLERVAQITGVSVEFIQGDILDEALLFDIFTRYQPTAVVHFAGLKAVGQSVAQPLLYYHNNVAGTVNLLRVMQKTGVKRLIFSSSATVYGTPKTLPITEDAPRSATSPYGQSKLMIEEMLEALTASDECWQVVSLRYFNPIGAHPSGLIGEDPSDIPNNLMPYITQVAVGKLACLSVFGDDYDTDDGTGVRDYIHVVDLAQGHVKALSYLEQQDVRGFLPINLGTGQGTSVLALVNAFVAVSGKKVPYQITSRRAGDVASCYASCGRAKEWLGWTATRSITQMCQDGWRWQQQNPRGYGEDND